MKTLKELQEEFQEYVIQDDPRVGVEVLKPRNMEVEGRLNVYRNAYYLRLVDILKEDYSVLYTMMGEDAFNAMVRAYLKVYPSNHYSVRTVGAHLAVFLKNTQACDPSFSELAAFEWAMNVALLAADIDTLTMDALAEVAPEAWGDMRLRLHPSVQTVTTHFNVMERWRAINDGEDDLDLLQLEDPKHLLVWRRDREVYFCVLSDLQYYLIDAIKKGECFGVLCETMLSYLEEASVVQWVASTLQTWVTEGVFQAFKSDLIN